MNEYNKTFGYTNKYLTKDNEPWFPIMGEFHFSRYDRRYWKESLLKMKAGGVNIVATYIIWIHHEEIEGEYNFEGNCDLRAFVETVKEVGLYLCLRTGPWSHAEARNGGFPDWLLKKDVEHRTNDENYLKIVEKYFTKLYEQVDNLFIKDGGPIMSMQIENEYGQCGGLTGQPGEDHMIALTELVKKLGFIVPIYTASGWCGAVTGGNLPVMGGYPEAPWSQSTNEIEPNKNFLFNLEGNDTTIGSDYGHGKAITFDINKFPMITAELGGGLQITRHRRPIANRFDSGALSIVKLGSGCSLLGYYMYHGGTNPVGKLSYFNEARISGGPSDLNDLNYDFRASIKEYGQISETYKEIKLLSLFTADFGQELCLMNTHLPDSNPTDPKDAETLRYTVRHNDDWGYIFVNNYQRKVEMKNHMGIELSADINGKTYTFPKTDVKNKDYFFYPVNMPLSNGNRLTAKVTPLCKINGEEVFYGNERIENVIVLSRKDAMDAYKVNYNNRDQLIISNSSLIQKNNKLEFFADTDITIKVYPDFESTPTNFEKTGTDGIFTIYKHLYKSEYLTVTTNKLNETDYEIVIPNNNSSFHDVFIDIDYMAEMADLYLDHEKVADEYFGNEIWQVGLRKFNFPKKLTLKLNPLHKTDKIYFEKWPEFEGDQVCKLNKITPRIIENIEMKF